MNSAERTLRTAQKHTAFRARVLRSTSGIVFIDLLFSDYNTGPMTGEWTYGGA